MEAKVNRKRHVSFFASTAETRSTYLSVIYAIFCMGPGVGVGVGAGVGVDQKPGVGVGTAPPRLRTPGFHTTKYRFIKVENAISFKISH